MKAANDFATLEARLLEPLPVHERVRLLNEMAQKLPDSDAARGARLAGEAIELARATGDAIGEAHGLHSLGRSLHAQSDYPAVFETQNAALAIFRALGDTLGESRCRNLLGATHRQLSDLGRALEMYEAALAGFRAIGEVAWQARVLSNIGRVEMQLGNHADALGMFDRALELWREAGDEEGAGFDLVNAAAGRIERAHGLRATGDAAACQAQADDALLLLDRALASARQFGHHALQAAVLRSMGDACRAMARPEVALGMASVYLQLTRDTGDAGVEAYGQACMGEVCHHVGEHAESVARLGDALATFEALDDREQQSRVLRLLSQAHEALGEVVEALSCVRRAGAIEQRLLATETERRARALAARRRLDPVGADAERPRSRATEDALTGLANRRQLDERLGNFMREALKSGSVVTVAMADVDHFMGINDRFSNAVGDEVLRCVGEILRAHCRLGDVAGRYGSEEFMLVFRNFDMRAASEACERVRRAVEGWDWKSIHPHLRVTLSIGLASSASFDEPQGVLDAAGHWLHEAKHHGRNQIQPMVVAPA